MRKDVQAAARLLSRLGNRARTKALSPERRAEIARNAVKARWAKRDAARAAAAIQAGKVA